jgi:hypothetical protein
MGGAGTAVAAPEKEPVAVGEPVTVKVPMYVKESGAQTDIVGRGDCGLIYVEVIPTGGGGARIEYGFESTLGVVADRTARVVYANATANPTQVSFFLDNGFMISSRFDGKRDVVTGAGRVIANFEVLIVLYNLTVCTGFIQDVGVVV